jgi:hypothetical protein
MLDVMTYAHITTRTVLIMKELICKVTTGVMGDECEGRNDWQIGTDVEILLVCFKRHYGTIRLKFLRKAMKVALICFLVEIRTDYTLVAS